MADTFTHLSSHFQSIGININLKKTDGIGEVGHIETIRGSCPFICNLKLYKDFSILGSPVGSREYCANYLITELLPPLIRDLGILESLPDHKPLLPGEFFVVCNTRGQSSHGICVGIACQGNLREAYICAKCTKAESNSHLYCICRQPYNKKQFYVRCDSCQNWSHGSSVNVTHEQAEEMKKYFCDKCRDNKQSVMDVKLMVKQAKLISKLVKDLKQHKLAWPFREPVNPVQYPHYYQIITNPMYLSRLKDNVDKGKYHSLSEVVNDTTKIFVNCRVFNSVDSIFLQCADGSGNYFVELLNKLKRKIVAERHRRESRDVLSELAGESSNTGLIRLISMKMNLENELRIVGAGAVRCSGFWVRAALIHVEAIFANLKLNAVRSR
ncbi:hypothetical protein GJ496_010782 [Pomphorhynchus laevis]|nr:hypothetical protein GJ496_010782 [Pomphorhynchus laevis]